MWRRKSTAASAPLKIIVIRETHREKWEIRGEEMKKWKSTRERKYFEEMKEEIPLKSIETQIFGVKKRKATSENRNRKKKKSIRNNNSKITMKKAPSAKKKKKEHTSVSINRMLQNREIIEKKMTSIIFIEALITSMAKINNQCRAKKEEWLTARGAAREEEIEEEATSIEEKAYEKSSINGGGAGIEISSQRRHQSTGGIETAEAHHFHTAINRLKIEARKGNQSK